tara:strand:+ start:364 stop:636 length:273 start_codon:yes stop_codon:yes gene_type:complete
MIRNACLRMTNRPTVELILTIWLHTGAVLREPTSWADCRDLYGWARLADATGQELHRDGAGLVVRLSCGGHDIVLALPESDALCEIEATS